MKNILFVLFVALLISACGGSKKVIASEESRQEQEVVIHDTLEIESNETITDVEEVEVEIEDYTELEEMIEETQVVEDVEAPKVESFDHEAWNSLLSKHVSTQGNVNYKGFKSDWNALRTYLEALSEKTPNNTWSKEDKFAYWINAYNAMTVDLILRNYPLPSIKDLEKPWDQRLWKLGAKWYTLNGIEHTILRKMGDARIHFGIVCASISCPKLQNTAFNAGELDAQLDAATREFLMDETKNNLIKDHIKLSKIFKWFAKDFKTKDSLIDFLNKYSEVVISQKAKKSFKDYNWNLNE